MRERDAANERDEVVQEIRDSHGGGREQGSSAGFSNFEAYQPEVVERMFAKMNQRLEDKYVNDPSMRRPARMHDKLPDKLDAEYETTLHNQVM